ncbi:hypothetical protein AGMMS49975_04060 [Clostridia bacterium]|nr:hypothetical protein AGMMS49975_04060 [Clostridia bacterium]
MFYLKRVILGLVIALVILALSGVFNRRDKSQPAPPPDNAQKIEAENVPMTIKDLIQLAYDIFQPETNYEETPVTDSYAKKFTVDREKLSNIDYLRDNFYIVDPHTGMSPDVFNVNEFMSVNLGVPKSKNGEPKILIFHTHSNEMFIDSNDSSEGVLAVGDKLSQILTRDGYAALHNTESFDMINGESHIQGAYERMEPVIMKILSDNPSIEMAIDIHRDGLPVGAVRQYTILNGQPTAKIMFFNGTTMILENGELHYMENLPNPYLKTNLALSFNAQLAAINMYPDFTKKIYLKEYRYSLNMLPKTLFVEVGSQMNTKSEAVAAAAPLAKIIENVIGGE